MKYSIHFHSPFVITDNNKLTYPFLQKNMDGTITTEFLVPTQSVGFVIGKAGETIKTIQEKSQCKVQFKSEQLEFSVLGDEYDAFNSFNPDFLWF